MRAFAADDDSQFALVLDALRIFAKNDRFGRPDNGAGRLKRNQRLFGDVVAEFSCVSGVVTANADNFFWLDGSEKAHRIDWQRMGSGGAMIQGSNSVRQ